MQESAKVQTIVQACHDATEKLIDAANTVMKPGMYHIAYHLAVQAQEEVGKASMVFMDSRSARLKTPNGEVRSLMDWIDGV
jgi:AbiV family abortive infection protein